MRRAVWPMGDDTSNTPGLSPYITRYKFMIQVEWENHQNPVITIINIRVPAYSFGSRVIEILEVGSLPSSS